MQLIFIQSDVKSTPLVTHSHPFCRVLLRVLIGSVHFRIPCLLWLARVIKWVWFLYTQLQTAEKVLYEVLYRFWHIRMILIMLSPSHFVSEWYFRRDAQRFYWVPWPRRNELRTTSHNVLSQVTVNFIVKNQRKKCKMSFVSIIDFLIFVLTRFCL